MPSEVTDIKQFLEIARRKDAKGARLKKSSKSKDIKLKIRCKRYLYTLILKDSDKADKIKQSLPPTMPFQEISNKTKKAKKA
ncbi:60S ribosomal protein L38 [Exophiala viscosa]|uniref:60S ribosomal protein L38 n=1 Tax=Exophiala viscosa TaxID=2486360 RepID=A0AAN6DZN9_9EURO|nr:60S ribosomal protein L38 [Exophiala viscosa]